MALQVVSALFVVVSCFSFLASCSTITYNAGNGHYFELVTTSALTYAQAQSQASARSLNGQQGYLVTISSEDEENACHDLFYTATVAESNDFGAVWSGAQRTMTDNRWYWYALTRKSNYLYDVPTQTCNGYCAWNSTDFSANYTCMQIFTYNANGPTPGKWRSASCTSKVDAMIVEYDASKSCGTGYTYSTSLGWCQPAAATTTTTTITTTAPTTTTTTTTPSPTFVPFLSTDSSTSTTDMPTTTTSTTTSTPTPTSTTDVPSTSTTTTSTTAPPTSTTTTTSTTDAPSTSTTTTTDTPSTSTTTTTTPSPTSTTTTSTTDTPTTTTTNAPSTTDMPSTSTTTTTTTTTTTNMPSTTTTTTDTPSTTTSTTTDMPSTTTTTTATPSTSTTTTTTPSTSTTNTPSTTTNSPTTTTSTTTTAPVTTSTVAPNTSTTTPMPSTTTTPTTPTPTTTIASSTTTTPAPTSTTTSTTTSPTTSTSTTTPTSTSTPTTTTTRVPTTSTTAVPTPTAKPIVRPVVSSSNMLSTEGGTLTIHGQNFGSDSKVIQVWIETTQCSNVRIIETDTLLTCEMIEGVGKNQHIVVVVNGVRNYDNNVAFSRMAPKIFGVDIEMPHTSAPGPHYPKMTVIGSNFGVMPYFVVTRVGSATCFAASVHHVQLVCNFLSMPNITIDNNMTMIVGGQYAYYTVSSEEFNSGTTQLSVFGILSLLSLVMYLLLI